MKPNISRRHIRRIIQASTNADLEQASNDAQLLESSLEESSSVSNSDDQSDKTIEDKQRLIEPIDNVSDNDSCKNTLNRSSSRNSYSSTSSNRSAHSNSSITSDDIVSSDDELNRSSDNCLCDHSEKSSATKQFKTDVVSWAIEHNIRQNACNSLLKILRKHTDCDFPKDMRTLLKTPRTTNVRPIGGGSYFHFGLDGVIRQMIIDSNGDVSNINLLLNIDGLPISKSSNASLWPILCSNDANNKVYMVGAFYGLQKPKDCNEYLEPLITELIPMIDNGFHMNDKLIQIRLHALVCDAPAKAFVLAVKSHTGYYSCTTCTVEGKYVENRVCFPKIARNPLLRTDEGFAKNLYEEYQTGYTILNTVSHFGAVSNVPRDYLHVIYFCGVKKPVLLWMKSGPLSVRLAARSIDKISEKLISLRHTVPTEFARRPRALSDVHHWKATEFRNFLLYTGPIVLKDVLKDYVYDNFMTLHVAITILASPILCRDCDYVDYAEALLENFVISFEKIYGKKYVSHNIHNMLHLTSDVRKYGPLDAFSAFRFENFMSSIKKLLRKSDKPLEQLARRYYEIQASGLRDQTKHNVVPQELCFKHVHSDGPLANFEGAQLQYKEMSNQLFHINCNNNRDNCCMLKNKKCVNIENIVQGQDNRKYIIGKQLKYVDNLYCLPCASTEINVKIVSTDTSSLYSWPVSEIICKLWKMPYKHNYVVVPVIHTI